MYKIRGMYYIMTASGGTAKDHREIIGRGTSPYGPFELYPEPILTHRSLEHPIQYLGHADLIEDPNGDWWAVFLGVRLVSSGYSVLGRETFLAPVTWSEDGWPMIDNNEGLVQLQMSVPRVPGNGSEDAVDPALVGKDDFDGDTLSPAWTFLRNPVEGSWSLSERPGWLSLRGQAAGLNDVAPVAFVGRRQQQVQAEWSTLLQFKGIQDGEEAGLCARRDEAAHYEVFLTRDDGQNKVVARVTVRGETRIAVIVPVYTDAVHLKIRSDESKYTLCYSLDGRQWTELASETALALSPEDYVSKMCFTGVVVGLYAAGNGAACEAPACFDWFDIQ